MAASDSEDEHGETWQYAPAQEQPRTTPWQVAEVLALVAGVMALAIAATSPLTVVHRAPGDLVSDMEVGSVQGDEMRLMRMQPVQGGSGTDTGDPQSSEIQSPEMLTRERALRAVAERHVHDAQVRLGAAAQEARRELEAEQTARQATSQRLSEVSEELARERTAKEAAELAAKEALSRKRKGWRLLKVERWTW
jgi:hypothetical protein